MLDHVERRALLVQPACKHPLPIGIGAAHVELDEGPGQPLGFPRRGRIARAEADQRILGADRLARFQREVADDAVTLVEQSDDRHALGHRRHTGGIDRRRQLLRCDLVLGDDLSRLGAAAGNRHRHHGNANDRAAVHASSGVQAL